MHTHTPMLQLGSLSDSRVLRPLFLAAVCLCLLMSCLSSTQLQIHHDEFDHRNAARYYYEHWLPPAVGERAALESYSLYGTSYLNELDVVYLFAGKFAVLIRPIIGNELLSLRLFNVSLFVVLAAIAIFRKTSTVGLAFLLISPQIWYLFSYFNGDALGIFASFLGVVALSAQDSHFNQRGLSLLKRCIPLGLCLALLFLSKRSFWAVGLFLWLSACWLEATNGERTGRVPRAIRVLLCLALVAGAAAAPRLGYDFYVNGLPGEKATKIRDTSDRLASPKFKPPFKESMKNSGVGITEMLGARHEWIDRSAKSSFGAYNYNFIWTGKIYYPTMYVIAGTLLAVVSAALLIKGTTADRGLLGLGVLMAVLIISLSVYHSWTADFQPQGRYLLGIVPIAAVLAVRARTAIRPYITNILVCSLFIGSFYSFSAVGIAHMGRFRDISDVNPNFRRIPAAPLAGERAP